MKLRNKKTGEVIDLKIVQLGDNYMLDHEVKTIFNEELTLKTFNRYFEDYEEKVPLIKNEKIRKLVKIWSKVNELDEVIYDGCKDCIYAPDCDNTVSISFSDYYTFSYLEHRRLYTITELCGE